MGLFYALLTCIIYLNTHPKPLPGGDFEGDFQYKPIPGGDSERKPTPVSLLRGGLFNRVPLLGGTVK
jgi:hypothetical protein